MPDVKCSIANCYFWKQDNKCGADVIMIASDNNSNANLNEEFAGESFSSSLTEMAKDSASTCCHTFKPKNS